MRLSDRGTDRVVAAGIVVMLTMIVFMVSVALVWWVIGN